MHNTEVKPDTSKTPCVPNTTDPYQHHHHLNMTNGEVGVARHHRETSAPGMTATTNECAGCGKKITDRFLLKALDMFWHEDCLKCGCCDCRLGEVGSSCYTKANLILCKRDYLRLFGNTGYCAACSKVIPAFEMVMRARNNVYHLECFACQQCNHRFCVGDRFYLCENKILCVYDYEERMVFANMAYSPNLALLRRQVTNFQQPGVADGERQPHQQHAEKGHQPFPVRKAAVAEPLVNGSSPSSSSALHSPENGHIMNAWGNARPNPNYAARYPAPVSYDEYQRMYATQLQHNQAHHHMNPISASVLSGSSSNAADDNISTSPDSGIVEGP